MKRRILLLVFCAAISILFAQDKRIRYYETVKPKYLDPVYGMQSLVGQRVGSLLYRPLYGRDRSLNIVPKLATTKIPKNSGSKYLLSIKPDMKWHDHTAIGIKDVLESFVIYSHDEEFFAPNYIRPYQYSIEGDKLVAKLLSGFDYNIIHFTIPILPRHKFPTGIVEPSSEFVLLEPVGNGPFYIKENQYTNKIIFKKFDEYENVMQQHTNIDEIELFVEVSRSQWSQHMKSGNVDILPTVPTSQISGLRDFQDIVLQQYANYSIEFIGFNFANDLLKELFIRKAMYHAYDRETTIQAALSGNGNISTGPYPVGSKYYWSALPGYQYDPEKAREILDKHCVKGPDGIYQYQGKRLSFKLAGSSGNSLFTQEAQTFVSMMKEVGIEIRTPNQYDPGSLIAHLKNKDFDLLWHKITYLSSETDVSLNYATSGPENYWGYSNTSVDAKLQELKRAEDPFVRERVGHEVHREIHSDPPCLFLWTEELYTAYNDKIMNFIAHPVEYFYLVEEWELQD